MATKKLSSTRPWPTRRKWRSCWPPSTPAPCWCLAFPLYVDHLPAPLIDLLRRIAERRQGRPGEARQALAAIVNCGFPETAHCRPAAEIMRLFAAQAGFRFLGCLALGMGGAIGNRPLAKAGGIVRHQVKALGQAAAYLAEGKEIPAAVIELMGKAMMPRWFYNLVADLGLEARGEKIRRAPAACATSLTAGN